MSKRNCRRGRDVGGGKKEEVEEGGDVLSLLSLQVLLEMSGVFSSLEPEIFLNIMSRVPLKSLSQCRRVCKSWYKLIKAPSFAKIQHAWAVKNNSPWVFFWTLRNDLYLFNDQDFDHPQTSTTLSKIKLNKFEQARDFPVFFQIAGYVNGLLCFASDPGNNYHPSPIYICNPITGEHITIPKSPKYKTPAIAAFGFDPTTSDYKVIRIVHSKDEVGGYLSSEGEVYTLGSSEWRKIEDVPRIEDKLRCGVLVNGNLHWISHVSDSPIINAFNVGSEKFDVIQPPPHLLQKGNTNKRLMVVEGHLCILHKEGAKTYEIWVMTDYGVQSSWVKKYSFKSKLINWFWYGSHDLIKLRSGEFLLQFEECQDEFLGYLDPEKGTFRPITIRWHSEDHGMQYYFRSVVQVGSLFSPKDIAKSWRGRKAQLKIM